VASILVVDVVCVLDGDFVRLEETYLTFQMNPKASSLTTFSAGS